jgi:hypothetical protein
VALVSTWGGCSDVQDDPTDQEIAFFQQKLGGGMSPSEACQELEVLCKATGFGCKAHQLFCQVPTKQSICQQLAAACGTYPAACDVFKSYCISDPCANGLCKKDAGPPYADAVVPPHCGNKVCEKSLGESCASCPVDCGTCKMDASPPASDYAAPPKCGNKVCEKWAGESCATCSIDCGTCKMDASPPVPDYAPPSKCGNKICEKWAGESCFSCPTDCGSCVSKDASLPWTKG